MHGGAGEDLRRVDDDSRRRYQTDDEPRMRASAALLVVSTPTTDAGAGSRSFAAVSTIGLIYSRP